MSIYISQLPRIEDLIKVSRLVRFFPARRDDLIRVARRIDSPEEVIAFLLRFPSDMVFDSRADFMIECEELEMLISEERETPPENLHSPQED